MDVDLLRPGTVPLAPDTILWFEFLLDPHLLRKHLSKPQPDPGPCELMVEFTSVVSEPRAPDVDAPASPTPAAATPAPPQHYSRKQLALKILTLKVAATLRWNLDTFESRLPPHVQQQVMQDLVYTATDGAFSVPPQEVPADLLQHAYVRFALTLYHRWMLRFAVNAALNAKANKMPFTHMSVSGDPIYNMIPSFEKVRAAEGSRAHSVRFLEEELVRLQASDVRRLRVPVMDSFIHLTDDSDDMKHDWEAGDTFMSRHELVMQIHYDLNYNYFFYGQCDLAKTHILACKESVDRLEREIASYGYEGSRETKWGRFNYASVSKEDIVGYIRSLNLAQEVLGEEPSLLQRLQESITNHYTGIIGVLQADNLRREIPLVYRQVVELDIQGSASSGVFTVARDLLNRVSALNAVRYSLEGGLPSSHPDFINKFKTVGIKFVDILFWAFGPVFTSGELSDTEWERVRKFFLHLVTSQPTFPADRVEEYLSKHIGEEAESVKKRIFRDEHLKLIIEDAKEMDDENLQLPPELLTDDWETSDFETASVPELEVGRLKRRLVEASAAEEVRMGLVKLAMAASSSPLWKLCPSLRPPPVLANTLVALPRGFLQDFGYIVSGAARARAEAGGARAALSLLSVLEGEARGLLNSGADPALYRLCRLLAWEVLLLQVEVLLADWPDHRLHVPALATKCKAALAAAAAGAGDAVAPRPQVVEACWACLVNAGEWEGAPAGGGGGAGWSEAAAALCAACLELQRSKPPRKLSRQLWEHALLVYANNPPTATKRSASGHSSHARDAPPPASEARDAFNAFLRTLRDPTAVTVACSLLARLHNLLKDDSNLELSIDHLGLWPATIANNNYNAKQVMDSLTALVERGLRLYPSNASWLRLAGDIHMANGHHGSALRQYLCSLIVSTCYFAAPLGARPPEEQAVLRRMVRCCAALGCPTQAAVLCQFPDEVDYGLAFKCLSEKVSGSADAMDGYYGCVWDATLLEFAVALHARRGEPQRRALAVRVAGALELNANNNEEIQREAANSRKAKMLRALAAQYLA